MTVFTTTLTVPASVTLAVANKPFIRAVSQFAIIVRSIGTATYVAVGGRDSQDRKLTSNGAYIAMDAPAGTTLNMQNVFVISDTADAVIEVVGDTA